MRICIFTNVYLLQMFTNVQCSGSPMAHGKQSESQVGEYKSIKVQKSKDSKSPKAQTSKSQKIPEVQKSKESKTPKVQSVASF